MSYLTFTEVLENKEKRKTLIFEIYSNCVLGKIKWHAPWRKYCFFPEGNTIWDLNCLKEVNDFIVALMRDRKKTQIIEEKQGEENFYSHLDSLTKF